MTCVSNLCMSSGVVIKFDALLLSHLGVSGADNHNTTHICTHKVTGIKFFCLKIYTFFTLEHHGEELIERTC